MATERRWRTLPDDLPIVATLRWLDAHGIAVEFRRCDLGDLHTRAAISDEGYAALVRDVRTPATQEAS